MREEYDFSDAVKNPFAGKKEKGKFTVTVHYDFSEGEDSSVNEKKAVVEQDKKQA